MELLRASGLRLTSMGRSIDEIPETFAAAVAAGTHAASLASVAAIPRPLSGEEG